MSDESARLVVRRGPTPNQEFVLTQEKATIGRAPTNDIPIPDPEISRRHAQFVRQGEEYAIEDLGSTNGTFVNGRRITGLTPLHHGDTIDCGEAISLEFFHHPEDNAATLFHAHSAASMQTVMQPPAFASAASPNFPPAQPPSPVAQPTSTNSTRRIFLGCGCVLVVLFLCTATLFFLDSYQGGQLLYCGPLRPLFNLLLGPIGFSPACS